MMWYPSKRFGGMAEWLKALVLKTSRAQALVGSNPTSSAMHSGPVARFERRGFSFSHAFVFSDADDPPRHRAPPSTFFHRPASISYRGPMHAEGGAHIKREEGRAVPAPRHGAPAAPSRGGARGTPRLVRPPPPGPACGGNVEARKGACAARAGRVIYILAA